MTNYCQQFVNQSTIIINYCLQSIICIYIDNTHTYIYIFTYGHIYIGIYPIYTCISILSLYQSLFFPSLLSWVYSRLDAIKLVGGFRHLSPQFIFRMVGWLRNKYFSEGLQPPAINHYNHGLSPPTTCCYNHQAIARHCWVASPVLPQPMLFQEMDPGEPAVPESFPEECAARLPREFTATHLRC